ncbi:MAG: hypothetical protein AB1445_05620 [Bacillota bacterium]
MEAGPGGGRRSGLVAADLLVPESQDRRILVLVKAGTTDTSGRDVLRAAGVSEYPDVYAHYRAHRLPPAVVKGVRSGAA